MCAAVLVGRELLISNTGDILASNNGRSIVVTLSLRGSSVGVHGVSVETKMVGGGSGEAEVHICVIWLRENGIFNL